MPSVKRVLMHSLASTVTPEVNQVRREQLQAIQNQTRRTGALALHDVATKRPEVVAAFLGLDYQPTALEHVGSGCESNVFRLNESDVLKVNFLSLIMSGRKRQEYARRARVEHQAMKHYLGSFIVPQETDLATHPSFPNREATQATQSFVEITDPQLFPSTSTHEMAQTIGHLRAEQPDIIDQLSEFLVRSQRLYREEGLLPDVLGHGNLVLDDGGSLKMIDGQPIAPQFTDAQARAASNLGYMSAALELAA
ncbi:MAG TPA: hypothetical protein VK712_03555 [Verrucomicrobiae bacterium]|jgi:hypothetical protein|nr:hypothetical protein [Verrucomicrobiae bacterium]